MESTYPFNSINQPQQFDGYYPHPSQPGNSINQPQQFDGYYPQPPQPVNSMQSSLLAAQMIHPSLYRMPQQSPQYYCNGYPMQLVSNQTIVFNKCQFNGQIQMPMPQNLGAPLFIQNQNIRFTNCNFNAESFYNNQPQQSNPIQPTANPAAGQPEQLLQPSATNNTNSC